MDGMAKRSLLMIVVLGTLFLGAISVLGWFFFESVSVPAYQSPTANEYVTPTEILDDDKDDGGDAATTSNSTLGFSLKLSDKFSIFLFADNLPGARVLLEDSFGNIWLSRTREGTVTMLEIDDEGGVRRKGDLFHGLENPHGLALDGTMLYIAEEDKISRIALYSEDSLHKIADLPAGGGHSTRTLGFGPDGRLYVSIGSSCNVCNEEDERRAKIFSMNKDGSDMREFARGLRNTVFFTWSPLDRKMWGTDMGRDLLGDDTPPEEINIIEEGKNYGWPICFGRNIHDTQFDKNTYIRNPCMEPFETASYIDMQAHSAPLGLAFIPKGIGWPAEYEGDLLVAFHGSWNRSVPTGYKVVRIKLDARGNYEGIEDFISGWLTPGMVRDKAYGRPVDLLFTKSGDLLISDDARGVIYKVKPKK